MEFGLTKSEKLTSWRSRHPSDLEKQQRDVI